jgi:hypothetical protein
MTHTYYLDHNHERMQSYCAVSSVQLLHVTARHRTTVLQCVLHLYAVL